MRVIEGTLELCDTGRARVTVSDHEGGLCTMPASELAPELLEAEMERLATEASGESAHYSVSRIGGNWYVRRSDVGPHAYMHGPLLLEDAVGMLSSVVARRKRERDAMKDDAI